MLPTVAIILAVPGLMGVATSDSLGGVTQVFLVAAVVVALVCIVRGRGEDHY